MSVPPRGRFECTMVLPNLGGYRMIATEAKIARMAKLTKQDRPESGTRLFIS